MQTDPGTSRELFALIGFISAWRGATRELTVRGRDLVLGASVPTVGWPLGSASSSPDTMIQ